MSQALRFGRWLGGVFSRRRRSLRGLSSPSPVMVRGIVGAGDEVHSPVSPVRGVAITTALLAGRVVVNDGGRPLGLGGLTWRQVESDESLKFRVAATTVRHGAISIDTAWGKVLIPEAPLKLAYALPLTRNPTELRTVPEVFRDAHDRLPRNAIVAYGERFLCVGDEVQLIATVRPAADGHGSDGPYRQPVVVDADFVVMPDRERPRLIER